jgi:hypothetical protein
MALKFPKDWKAGETKICNICLEASRQNPLPDGTIEYYGGVGEHECEKCGSYTCPIHFSFPDKCCSNCTDKKDKDTNK